MQTGHSMGGALVLAYCTRTPAYPNVNRLAGVISSSPLLRQAKGVRASGIIVKAGSWIGKLSPTLTLKAAVKPEVRDESLYLIWLTTQGVMAA